MNMKRFKMISIAVLAVLGVIIILQNTEQVETRILFFSFTMRRAFLLMSTTLIGFALGILVALFFPKKEPTKDINK